MINIVGDRCHDTILHQNLNQINRATFDQLREVTYGNIVAYDHLCGCSLFDLCLYSGIRGRARLFRFGWLIIIAISALPTTGSATPIPRAPIVATAPIIATIMITVVTVASIPIIAIISVVIVVTTVAVLGIIPSVTIITTTGTI